MEKIPGIADIPTHVVPIAASTSPEWAQQERWAKTIQNLCLPCKEPGIHPILSEQYLAVAKDRPLACRYYTDNYDSSDWNRLKRHVFRQSTRPSSDE